MAKKPGSSQAGSQGIVMGMEQDESNVSPVFHISQLISKEQRQRILENQKEGKRILNERQHASEKLIKRIDDLIGTAD